jgi:chorismate synthase
LKKLVENAKVRPIMLRFLTAGESHGPMLLAIVEGLPSGLEVDPARIDGDLARRQQGYGRGGRMKIEQDAVQILSGVRHGYTLGSPVGMCLPNRDWPRWETAMALVPVDGGTDEEMRRVHRPRPGHADLAGGLKYGRRDLRDVLERASARETAARTAVGGLCRILLGEFGVEVASHVIRVGQVAVPEPHQVPWEDIRAVPFDSPLGCVDSAVEARMIAEVDRARSARDSVNGAFQVVAHGVPAGLGSHVQWDRKLDGTLLAAIGSIPAVKAASVGAGVEAAALFGSEVHDEIFYEDAGRGYTHRTNRAGGLEGGVTNGEEIRVTGFMKPLSTLPRPLRSVDIRTHRPSEASFERTDTTAIRAAGVVGEAMTCFVLAREMCTKFGGDSLEEMRRNFEAYCEQLRSF